MDTTPKLFSSRTSSDCCPAEKEAMPGVIIRQCSKRSQRAKFQCLDLDAGQVPEWSEAEDLISLGLLRTPNITERHSEEGGCLLSSILQDGVPEKYSLSPRACQGILRRAQARGKELPPILKAALEARAAEAKE